MQTIEQIRAAYDKAAGSDLQCQGRFAVASFTVKEGKGGEFATVELRDPSGSMVARCFDAARVAELRGLHALECRVKVSAFNGSMSVIINSFSPCELSPDEVLRYAGLDAEAHALRVQLVRSWLDSCDGTVYGDVLREIFTDEVWTRFTMAPAAVRMHHAEPGGLVRHICEVGKAGLALLESTGDSYDRAYFLAGVLLHDIGKLDTYTAPPTISYTAQGQLAEHQIWSTFRLAKACALARVPSSIEAKLVHIIEQAHGAYRHAEWQDPLGSEVKALAAADFFSSRLGLTDKERRCQEALDALLTSDSQAEAQGLDAEDLASSSSPAPDGLF